MELKGGGNVFTRLQHVICWNSGNDERNHKKVTMFVKKKNWLITGVEKGVGWISLPIFYVFSVAILMVIHAAQASEIWGFRASSTVDSILLSKYWVLYFLRQSTPTQVFITLYKGISSLSLILYFYYFYFII